MERGKPLETQKTTSDGRNLPGYSTRRISNSERLLGRSFAALRILWCGAREGYEHVRTQYHQGTVKFHLAVSSRLPVCPHCQERELIRRAKRWRRIQNVRIGLKPVLLVTDSTIRGCGQDASSHHAVQTNNGQLLPRWLSSPLI